MLGILLPVRERQEQINKHAFGKNHDNDKFHQKGELINVALYYLTGDVKYYPKAWADWMKNKYKRKSHEQRIVIAIALLMAEVDRITGSTLSLPDLQLRRAEYKKGPNQFYYVILAKNGQVLATSEQYTRRSSARRACHRLNESIGSYLAIKDATEEAIPFPKLEKLRA